MSRNWLQTPDCKVLTGNNVWQAQKMHEAQETSASEERSAKRRKTSPEVPAAKKKPAISRSTWYVLDPTQTYPLSFNLFMFMC